MDFINLLYGSLILEGRGRDIKREGKNIGRGTSLQSYTNLIQSIVWIDFVPSHYLPFPFSLKRQSFFWHERLPTLWKKKNYSWTTKRNGPEDVFFLSYIKRVRYCDLNQQRNSHSLRGRVVSRVQPFVSNCRLNRGILQEGLEDRFLFRHHHSTTPTGVSESFTLLILYNKIENFVKFL